jgi:hypothetical protein
MRHSKTTVTKACQLYQAGTSVRDICKKTGIKSTSTVMYHCNPAYKADMNRRNLEWRKKNPKRWAEIRKKAIANHKEKKQNA